jgi:ubiquinone/menaquinone biosynthesis C-methylase UbiE
MSPDSKDRASYSALAAIYDTVMKEIDYVMWSDFIDEIIQTHHSEAEDILELACGTGSFALALDELDIYNIHATDGSNDMLEVARQKSALGTNAVTWEQVDYYNINHQHTYDVVLMLYDSINYALHAEDVLKALLQVKPVLRENGVFIFDFTTPSNSVRHAESLNDEGSTPDNYRYIRLSRYLPSEKMHYNEFEIEKLAEDKIHIERRYREVHKQRVYTLEEMRSIVSKTPFNIVAEYDSFELEPANENSDRITLVLA